MSTPNDSPFHSGEREIQTRLGVREALEQIGRRVIRDHLPQQHREFYAQLETVLVGSTDANARPWASILVGAPGFAQAPDAHTLQVQARRWPGDPLNGNLAIGAPVGVLGIEYTTRRRNRLTGSVAAVDADSVRIDVAQTFGNCPRYIQTRELRARGSAATAPPAVTRLRQLDQRCTQLIRRADHFFIATHCPATADGAAAACSGADVSHRGGRPGFVRVDADCVLTFPDFAGNRFFNTLGNILRNPLAGVLFIDADAGDLLYLTCAAEIVWDSAEQQAFAGAERLVRLTLDEGVLVRNALPLRWRLLEYSPHLTDTGVWR